MALISMDYLIAGLILKVRLPGGLSRSSAADLIYRGFDGVEKWNTLRKAADADSKASMCKDIKRCLQAPRVPLRKR